MSIYITRENHKRRDLLPEFRDFKLKLIQSDIKFLVTEDVIKKYHTEFKIGGIKQIGLVD